MRNAQALSHLVIIEIEGCFTVMFTHLTDYWQTFHSTENILIFSSWPVNLEVLAGSKSFALDSDGVSAHFYIEIAYCALKTLDAAAQNVGLPPLWQQQKVRPHDERGRTVEAHDSALQKDNRVSFGSSEQHRVVFVIRKYPWKYIHRCCHLSPDDKAWQSAQYNLCAIPAWHIDKSQRGLTVVTKLGLYGQYLISVPSNESDPWLSFCQLKKSVWGAPLLVPFYWSTEHIQADFSL